MGKSWAADLALVDVKSAADPKPVTLIIPHYENQSWLGRQVNSWIRFPSHVLERLEVIIVDDCSPSGPPAWVLELDSPLRVRLFYVERDVRWNWIAARNIGAYHAADGWILMTDIDHVIVGSTLDRLQAGAHDPRKIYGFSRLEYTGAPINPHPNSWFLTRQMFWTVGGYDETLSGHYGTDGDWRRRMAAVAKIEILRDHLVRYEHVLDSSTTIYKRKQPEDAAVKTLIAKRRNGWRPRVLSFPYYEVKR